MLPIAVTSIAQWIPTRFDLPVVRQVGLLRAYTNDVYLVETRDQRYVLKVYGAGWRQDSEIRFEVGLLNHLASKGIHVARAIPRCKSLARSPDKLAHWVN